MKKLIAAFAVVLAFAAVAEKPPFDLKKKPQTEEEKRMLLRAVRHGIAALEGWEVRL